MRLRNTLTVGVCLLLMCASSLVSSCELGCSLSAGHQHVSINESSQEPVAMHASHCAHMLMGCAHHGWANSITQASGCVQNPCWRPDVSSTAVKDSASPLLADQWAVAAIGGGAELLHFQSTVSPGRRDLQSALSPPLSRVLRI